MKGGSMTTPPNLAKLIGQSEFILQARVEKMGEATLSLVPVTKETAIVVVDQVLRRPPGLGGLSGRAITVQFKGKPTVSKGQNLLIFAQGWLYGTSIVLKEYGHVRASASLQRKVIETEQKLQKRVLRDRIVRAEVIVTGRVKEVRLLSHGREQSREEEAEWEEVVLEITSWEKPIQKKKAIRIVCPVQADRRFPHARIFHRTQEGIWMLRGVTGKIFQGKVYIAEDAPDFQPLEKLEMVRSLIQEV